MKHPPPKKVLKIEVGGEFQVLEAPNTRGGAPTMDYRFYKVIFKSFGRHDV